VQRSDINPDDLLKMYPKALAAQLRPSAELAIQLVGLTPDDAEARANGAGFGFTAIADFPDGKVALPANLIVGRILGFVRSDLVRSVRVG
jgi:hypothetical protein